MKAVRPRPFVFVIRWGLDETLTPHSQGRQVLSTAGCSQQTNSLFRHPLLQICVIMQAESQGEDGVHSMRTTEDKRAKTREKKFKEPSRVKDVSFSPQPAAASARSPSSVSPFGRSACFCNKWWWGEENEASETQGTHSQCRASNAKFSPQPAEASARSPSSVTPFRRPARLKSGG